MPVACVSYSFVPCVKVVSINVCCLVNDNLPVRVVNKPFSVVRHGQRLLTRNDLWYRDPDVNQNNLELKIVRRGITNGDIINATTKREVKIDFVLLLIFERH